jgi:hypothetical protein
VRAEVEGSDGSWTVLTDLPMTHYAQTTLELPTEAQTGRRVRLSLRAAAAENAGVAELRVAGKLNN